MQKCVWQPSLSSFCLSHLSTCLCWLAVIWAAIKVYFTEGEHKVSSLHLQLFCKNKVLRVWVRVSNFNHRLYEQATCHDCWNFMLIMMNERKIKYIDDKIEEVVLWPEMQLASWLQGAVFCAMWTNRMAEQRKGRFQRMKGFKRGLEG